MRSLDTFKRVNLKNKKDYSYLRWTLDQKEDLKVIDSIIKNFKPNIYFSWSQILKVTQSNKENLIQILK